jgi:hypothetical protein
MARDNITAVFIENCGQFNNKISFMATIEKGLFCLRGDEINCLIPIAKDKLGETARFYSVDKIPKKFSIPKQNIDIIPISFRFVGANSNMEIIGSNLFTTNRNYFLGNKPEKWFQNVRGYGKIIYKNIYENIDLEYFFDNDSFLNSRFIIGQDADISNVIIEIGGEDYLYYDEGALKFYKEGNEVCKIPMNAFQDINGQRHSLSSSLKLYGDNKFGFSINGDFYTNEPIILELSFVWGSFLGGSSTDEGMGICLDDYGDIYVIGSTMSIDFPTINPYQDTLHGSYDIFVTKISSIGDSILYSTYIGGDQADWATDIAVDDMGCAYLTGSTFSSNFPTTSNSFDTSYNGGGVGSGDIFITKLSPSGDSLIYSTFVGGSNSDRAYDIVVDNNYYAYITGYTGSDVFPLENPLYFLLRGNSDAFISKLSPDGSSLMFSTYFGGEIGDTGWNLAVDELQNIYVGGWTNSTDFPLYNAFDSSYGGERDGFFVKIPYPYDTLGYSSYIGGDDEEGVFAIDVDNAGSMVLAGYTHSQDFPLFEAYDSTYNGQNDIFISKVTPAGGSLLYSTFFGGSSDDMAWSISLDESGNPHFTGYTSSSNFPVEDAFDDTYNGGGDAFVSVFSEAGEELIYSTYLGGGDLDQGHDLFLNVNGKSVITGKTLSSDFPALNGFDQSFNGDSDCFIVSFEDITNIVEEYNIPVKYDLAAFPNPFNSKMYFSWTQEEPSFIKINIYDILGRNVERIFEGNLASGSYHIFWNADNLKSGIYFCEFQADGFIDTIKLTLLK